ncbi:hypothetical protein HYT45_04645 [Candidatus Uhrbacteria bacterium]|nr:hypothetical protein [Candidatus Uhrbacteria bacterium]
MDFSKLFNRAPKPTAEDEPLEKVPGDVLLRKLSEAKDTYDSAVVWWNHIRHPDASTKKLNPGIEFTETYSDISDQADRDLEKARRELRRIEEEVRRRNLSV